MMIRTFGAAALLSIAAIAPPEPAAAQDPLSGALLGGAAGALIGGAATGRAGGALVGGIIGGTAGAVIGVGGSAAQLVLLASGPMLSGRPGRVSAGPGPLLLLSKRRRVRPVKSG